MFEVLDRPALERCLSDDALGKRLKLLIKAVKCNLPFPGKGPKEADTVGYFFGKGASVSRSHTPDGVEVVTVQIDLFSVTILRWALQSVGFRQGNVIDAILVDWPGQAVVASFRLAVTDNFLKPPS
jgi:transposase InsO family protein